MKGGIQLLAVTVLVFLAGLLSATAADGVWVITNLDQYGGSPSINNSNEIVWQGPAGGIFSSKRGQISPSGFRPRIANSGEIVYADSFEGSSWDLVSTTRGRLTQGGIININYSGFDVNTNGEVVYATQDTNGQFQVYSTVRGQITFDPNDHYNPCINDHGEIAWNEFIEGGGTMAISSTRGVLGFCPLLTGLNNFGDYCYLNSLEDPPGSGNYTYPHFFTSLHGAVINDPNQYQTIGGINDQGMAVWDGFGSPYEGVWEPNLFMVADSNGLALEWSTNAARFYPQFATNCPAGVAWHTMPGVPLTNGGSFHLNIECNLGTSAFFRLSDASN
jgi:hypothetical protein